MSAKTWIKIIIAFVSVSALAQMDESTHSLLIGKLERALVSLPPRSSERPSVTLRLADLYADRARLTDIAKQEGTCKGCPDGHGDRSRAIALYKSVVEILKVDMQGEVLLQMAHLANMEGKTKEAIATLNRASNSKVYDAVVNSRANAAMGEIYFRQANYAKAEAQFKKALSFSGAPQAGFLNYRLCWSQLNQGHTAEATKNLIKLLNNPEQMTREQNGKVEFDQSFHDDVTRDLVTFLARGNVGQKEIDLLLNLSPEHLRRENSYALANELERLGKKYSATLAWKAYYDEGDNTPAESLETQIRLAQLQWDMGRRDLALGEYAKAIQEWRKKGCKSDKCEELGKRLKNFVVNWNKIEKDQPTRGCLEAYKLYLQAFNQDAQMTFLAATVADQLKLPQEANPLYAQAASLAEDQKKDPANRQLLEASLMKQIETAELTKNNTLRLRAYDTYLEMNPQGQKLSDVRYQKAHVTYEMGQLDKAYDQFMDIATDKNFTSRDLKIKSADLILDILATRKAHDQLFSVSGQLLKSFPERQTEFSKIQRQAAIQMAAGTLDKSDSSNSKLKEESNRLRNLSLVGVSLPDQILILKNRISLGERRQDLGEVQAAANTLLNLKGAGPANHEFALSRLVWVAELSLDFKSALRLSKRMSLSEMSQEDKHLKFAMLSELAGIDPTPEYRAALRLVKNATQAQAIRVTLVRLAKRPWNTLNEFKSSFAKNPELFSTLIIESYSRDANTKAVIKLLKEPSLRRSTLAVIFSRRDFVKKWERLDYDLKRHQMRAQSDTLLQKTLTQRIAKLGAIDSLGREAVKLGDWESQLLVLNSVARENQRLYDELIGLPVPRRLKGNDRISYQNLLKNKAEPFAVRARQASAKVREFWNNEQALKEITNAYDKATGSVRRLLGDELSLLARLAPSSEQRQIRNAIAARESSPSAQDLARAKLRLQKEPFDTDVIAEVKRLSEARGETTMVAYLDARLNQLRKGARR